MIVVSLKGGSMRRNVLVHRCKFRDMKPKSHRSMEHNFIILSLIKLGKLKL